MRGISKMSLSRSVEERSDEFSSAIVCFEGGCDLKKQQKQRLGTLEWGFNVIINLNVCVVL